MDNDITFNIGMQITYAKSMWSHLIVNGIIPFIKKEQTIQTFTILLTKRRGSQVSLILTTEKKDSRKLAEKTDLFFREFLTKNPSPDEPTTVMEGEWFMNLENNKVYYGGFDYNNEFKKRNQNPKSLLDQKFSVVFIQIFELYQLETLDNIIEILIELSAVLCKAVNLNESQIIELFNTLLDQELEIMDNEEVENTKLFIEKNFDENKGFICEYLSSTQNHNFVIEEPWQKTWFKLIKDHFDTIEDASTNGYVEMINMAIHFFNIEIKSRITAFSFVARGFEELSRLKSV